MILAAGRRCHGGARAAVCRGGVVWVGDSDDNDDMSQNPPNIPDYRGPASGKATPSPELSADQLAELARAKERGAKLKRAVRVATADAWVTAIFAAGAILTSCGGIEQFLIGLALGWVAFNSFRGAARLKRFELDAPGRLAFNQIVLASAIILYASYSLWQVSTGKSALLKVIAGDTNYGEMGLGSAGKMVGDIQNIIIFALKLTYLLLIIGTIVGQGLTALYYKSRRRILDEYLNQTPQWVVDLQKSQLG
jgi:hypothetical protein